ncbi:MAG: hypothetical protein FWC27_07610 [Firmicutes bacterium]|nr:hypothetical protein [Bacillota bacterium]
MKKRILATVLAALMIFGGAAIGAYAIEEPESAVLQASEFEGLTAAQSIDLWSKLLDFTKYMNKEQVYKAAWLVLTLEFAQGAQEAMKDPAKLEAFDAAVAEALGKVDLTIGDTFEELINAFLEDQEAVVVDLYKKGQLQAQLGTLFGAYLAGFIGELQPLVDEYVKTEVVDLAKSYAKVANVIWDLQLNNLLTMDIKTTVRGALKELRKNINARIKSYAASGRWTDLAKEINKLIDDSTAAFNRAVKAAEDAIKAGQDAAKKAVSFIDQLLRVWNWIKRYIFFGWLFELFR